MGIFDFFNQPKESSILLPKINWLKLETLEQLNQIVEDSHKTTALIFKHSTRCSISRTVLKNFEKEFVSTANVPLYYLDLLNFRSISNEISERFGVFHESPQLLVIKNGACVYNKSHESIDAESLKWVI